MRYIAIHEHNGDLNCWFTPCMTKEAVQEYLDRSGSEGERCVVVIPIQDDEAGALLAAIGGIEQTRDALEALLTNIARAVKDLRKTDD